ncbi:MAG: DUF4381 family protein [Verrucomicrobiaceae bacterium]|jgi:hypothetical protein|nr:MAG: DUF4381 family protein [Verrucomicrobiaceae bacterium]RPJ32546.1 MAG: DUF4381 family protein [Verrucomicrobiaceae bacterium]
MFHFRSIFWRSIALGCLSTTVIHGQPAEDDIRGPKPLVDIPEPGKFPVVLWALIAGVVLLLAIAAFLWRRHARSKRLRSPREIALASLAELEAGREVMTAESFANRAAQTVRQYISDRFDIAAPRRTTEEFLRDLTADPASPLTDKCDHLRGFLKSCDLAKFAGREIDLTHRAELVQAARGFIEATASSSKPESSTKP